MLLLLPEMPFTTFNSALACPNFKYPLRPSSKTTSSKNTPMTTQMEIISPFYNYQRTLVYAHLPYIIGVYLHILSPDYIAIQFTACSQTHLTDRNNNNKQHYLLLLLLLLSATGAYHTLKIRQQSPLIYGFTFHGFSYLWSTRVQKY